MKKLVYGNTSRDISQLANMSKRKGMSSPGPEASSGHGRTGPPLASPFPWLELKRVLVLVLTSPAVVSRQLLSHTILNMIFRIEYLLAKVHQLALCKRAFLLQNH